MNKIKKITIERLHNEEDFGFQKLIEAATIHLTLKADQEMVENYKVALLAYDIALKSNIRNSHTIEVVKISALTDTAWRGLQAQIKVALKHPNESCRTTAAESNNIIHKYGNVNNMGYNEKYGSAFNMLQDFNVLGEEKQRQISIYDWLVELQTRYDLFMVTKIDRVEEESHRITGLVKDMRKNADAAYYELVENVNALARINGVEAYARFITNVNVIIDGSKAVIAARKTRAKHKLEANDDVAVEG